MEKSTEKSVYELLAMTASDSSTISDVPDIVFRAEQALPKQQRRKRRLKRHQRNLNSNHTTCDEEDLMLHSPSKSNRFCPYLNHSILYCFCVAIVLSWLITLTLLLLSFHSELSQLDSSVEKVVAGSQGVPDALQKCHSLSKQLERNQTDLANKFSSLTLQIKNFSIQISTLHDTVSALESKLSASPQVLDVPARLSELSNNVASFGSTLNDLTNTVAKLQEASGRLSGENGALRGNVSSLKESIEIVQQRSVPGSADQSAKLESRLTELSHNLTRVNDTLSARLTFLHDDQVKNHVHLEDLESVNANLSSRVTSVTRDVTSLTASLSRVSELVTGLDTGLVTLRDGLRRLNVSVGGAVTSPVTASAPADALEQSPGPSEAGSSQGGETREKGDGGDLAGSVAPLHIQESTAAGPFDLNLLPSGAPTSELGVSSRTTDPQPLSSRPRGGNLRK